MELHDYVRIVRRRWRLVAVSVLIVVAVAFGLTFRVEPQYTSTARMFVSTTQRSPNQALQGGSFAIQRVSSYAELVKGHDLAARVSADPRLGMTAAEVSQKVTAAVVPGTVLLTISATDPDPKRAQELAQVSAKVLTLMVKELETRPGQVDPPIRAAIVDAAVLPTVPVSPQPLRNLSVALLLGLLAGLGLAVARELLDTTIRSSDDVRRLTDAPLLGGIVHDSREKRSPLMTSSSPDLPQAEAFRVLRNNLQFLDANRVGRVIAVTSPLPYEGKSFTATHLALALQSGGQRTLLIDGDLRMPQRSGDRHDDAALGLTAILTGSSDLAAAVELHGPSGLSLLASGTPSAQNPGDLLQSLDMAKLIESARSEYEVVVIDCPPLLPYSEAALIAALTDGAVVVIRCGKTKRDQLVSSLERLSSIQANVLGVTLDVDATRGRRRYSPGQGFEYIYEAEPRE